MSDTSGPVPDGRLQTPNHSYYEPELAALVKQYQGLARAAEDKKALDEFVQRRKAETLQRLQVRVISGCVVDCPSKMLVKRIVQSFTIPSQSGIMTSVVLKKRSEGR